MCFKKCGPGDKQLQNDKTVISNKNVISNTNHRITSFIPLDIRLFNRTDLWLNSLSICVECTVQYAETYPVEERNVIKQVRVGKGKNSQHLTQPWALYLQESDREREKDIFLFINDNISFSAGGEVM